MNLCEKYFDIHGFLAIKLKYPKFHQYYSGINFPFEYFEVPHVTEPNITFVIGKFDRKKTNCDIIFRNYEIDNNYIYFKRRSAGSEYEVEIEMISGKSLIVKFNWIKQRKIDLFLPYYRPQLLILEPLIEFLLLLDGKVLLHAGAVTTPEGASIFAGRSGSGKTSIIKFLIHQKGAHYYLGDDKVILHDGFAYAFPKNICLFDYAVSRDQSINELDVFSEKIRSLIYLLKAGSTKRNYVAKMGKVDSVYLLLTDANTDKPKVGNVDKEYVLKSMVFNNYAEYWNYYDLWEAFIAYSYYDPKFPFKNYLNLLGTALNANLAHLKCHSLALPYHPDLSMIKEVVEIVMHNNMNLN